MLRLNDISDELLRGRRKWIELIRFQERGSLHDLSHIKIDR